MLQLSIRQQQVIGFGLAALMAVTRGHHFASVEHLPESSWAVFLLAGIYLRPLAVFAALMIEAVLLDYAAITFGGVSSFCVSPAYVALVPAYAALWGAGRWYAQRHRDALVTLLPLAIAAMGGTAVCELISSGSFYFLSGRFPEPTLAEFGARYVRYLPGNLSTVALYTAVAAVVHAIVLGVSRSPKVPASPR